MRIFGVVFLISFFCFNSAIEVYSQIDDVIYEEAPQMPRFPGCENLDRTGSQKRYCAEKKLREFVSENINYPEQAKVDRIEGEVILSFVVERDGSTSNIAVKSGLGKGCDEEALRLAGMFPKWIPGRKKGKKVRVNTLAVIEFVLPKEEEPRKKKKKKTASKNTTKESKGTNVRKLVAKKRIERLIEGVLIVRLQARTNKVAALKRLIQNASTDQFRQESQLELDRTIFVRDSVNKELVDHFSQAAFYNFSEVLFMIETDKKKLLNGEQSGYFLNKNMEVDPSISLDNRKFLTTYLGTTPRADGARAVHTAFVVLDEFGYPLSWPFPAYVEWRKRLLSKKDSKLDSKYFFTDISTRDAVIKFNRKMAAFYENTRDW